MNRTSRGKTVVFFIVSLVLLLTTRSFAQTRKTSGGLSGHLAVIDEKGKIELIVDELRSGIRSQRSAIVYQKLSKDFTESENGIPSKEAAKANLEETFRDAINRPIQRPDSSFSTVWDFDITDLSIKVHGKSAHVDCVLRFYLLSEDSADSLIDLTKGKVKYELAPSGRGKRAKTRFVMVKRDNTWQLKNSGKLFGFLKSSMARFASENRGVQQIPLNKTINGSESKLPVSEEKQKAKPKKGELRRVDSLPIH